MDEKKRLLQIILNIAVPVVEIAVFLYVVPRLIKFFLPFVIGWFLALVAAPLVKLLEKRLKMLRRHSSMLIVVGVLALVIGGIYFVLSWAASQLVSFAADLPALYQTISLELREIFLQYDHIFAMLPDTVQQTLQRITGNVGEAVGLVVQQIASPTVVAAGTVAKHIPNALVNFVITVLSAYCFIVDLNRIQDFLRGHLWVYIPEGWKRCWRYMCEDGRELVGGYFIAQARIMLVIAAILVAGFCIFRVRHGVWLGILVAILDFLPLFGTGMVLIPWAVLQVVSGKYALAAGLALLYVLTQLVRQMIQPKIVGDALGLPPLWTLAFLYLGFRWRGISGMILAVPAGIFVLRLVEHGVMDEWLGYVRELGVMIREFRGKGDGG